jgi:hypothetical protein
MRVDSHSCKPGGAIFLTPTADAIGGFVKKLEEVGRFFLQSACQID